MSEHPIVAGMRDLIEFLDKPTKDIDKNLATSKILALSSLIEHASEIPAEAFAVMPTEMQQGTLNLALGLMSSVINS